MGVEPTVACSAQPTTNFEDWGIHRDTNTPTSHYNDSIDVGLCWLFIQRGYLQRTRQAVIPTKPIEWNIC